MDNTETHAMQPLNVYGRGKWRALMESSLRLTTPKVPIGIWA